MTPVVLLLVPRCKKPSSTTETKVFHAVPYTWSPAVLEHPGSVERSQEHSKEPIPHQCLSVSRLHRFGIWPGTLMETDLCNCSKCKLSSALKSTKCPWYCKRSPLATANFGCQTRQYQCMSPGKIYLASVQRTCRQVQI